MLFRRRNPETFMTRLRTWVWPRRSWSRSLMYFMRRLERLEASPHQVALGCAAGVFASITPLLGTQMVLAAVLAIVIRANVPAALIGTFFGNPISWPLIWGGSYIVGCYILGVENALTMAGLEYYLRQFGSALATWSPEVINHAVELVWPVLKPMLAGSVPIGLLAAVLSYYALRPIIATYQKTRVPVHLPAPSTI